MVEFSVAKDNKWHIPAGVSEVRAVMPSTMLEVYLISGKKDNLMREEGGQGHFRSVPNSIYSRVIGGTFFSRVSSLAVRVERGLHRASETVQ